MLVLSRKLGQRVQVGGDIKVTIVKIDRHSVRIGIEAPDDVTIHRRGNRRRRPRAPGRFPPGTGLNLDRSPGPPSGPDQLVGSPMASRIRRQAARRPARSSSLSAFGPSERALSGSGWTSRKRASQPTATAALAEIRNHRAFSARHLAAVSGRGKLDRVGGVEDDRSARSLHLRDRAKVVDQSTVPEGRSTLGQDDPGGGFARHLGHDIGHVPRGHELPLLDVERPSRHRRRFQEVGLTGEERRNLEPDRQPRQSARLDGSRGRRSSPGGRSRP